MTRPGSLRAHRQPARSSLAARSATAHALVVVAALLVPAVARAHFRLLEPASWMSQDSLGDPQKTGPCGNEAGGTATGTVTELEAGQRITIRIDETVFHPGHYRIALSVDDRSELPPEPPVTPGSSACGSVEIQDPPVFPVLADGVFEHDAPFGGEQTIQVQLPSDVTCDRCTLQVLEFMSSHGAPCFYHHCADVSIRAPGTGTGGAGAGEGGTGGSMSGGGVGGAGGAPPPGGVGVTGGAAAAGAMGAGGMSAGTVAGPVPAPAPMEKSSDSGGCSFRARSGSSAPLGWLGTLLVLAIWLARRRRGQASSRRVRVSADELFDEA